jgi:hypothetical protein
MISLQETSGVGLAELVGIGVLGVMVLLFDGLELPGTGLGDTGGFGAGLGAGLVAGFGAGFGAGALIGFGFFGFFARATENPSSSFVASL